MRTKENLKRFDEINTFLKYLYLGEEHTITIQNNFNCDLVISMDSNLNIMVKNMTFPHLPSRNMTSDFTPIQILSVIEKMKKMPHSGRFNNPRFTSYWDEISSITNINLYSNG